MPLRFLTQNHQLIFADYHTREIVNAGAIKPGGLYNVYAVLENTDRVEYRDVQVEIRHGGFGISYAAGTTGLTQPQPITIPPDAHGCPGLATVTFTFHAPTRGTGSLVLQITPNGPFIGQSISIAITAKQQAISSFLVFDRGLA